MKSKIKSTWTYRHIHLLITLALGAALLWTYFGADLIPKPDIVEYVAPCNDLQCLIEERADEIHQQNQWLYKEMARTDAMEEIGREVVQLMYME